MATKYWKSSDAGDDSWDATFNEFYRNWFDDAECTVRATVLPADGDAIVVDPATYGPPSTPPPAPLTLTGFTQTGGAFPFPAMLLTIAGGPLTITGGGTWEGNAADATAITITDSNVGAGAVLGDNAVLTSATVQLATIGNNAVIDGTSGCFGGTIGNNATFRGTTLVGFDTVGEGARFEEHAQLSSGSIGAGATFANAEDAGQHNNSVMLTAPTYVETVAWFPDEPTGGASFRLLNRTARVIIGSAMIDASSLPAGPVPAAPLMVIG